MTLTRRELIELAYRIEERRRALAAELQEEGLAPEATPADVADTERDYAELHELDAARARIDDGLYGLCTDCGGDIAVERLRAQPGAARCLACQQRHER